LGENLVWPDKDPGDKRTFSVSGEDVWDSGETVASAVWTIPDGITKVGQNESGQEAFLTLQGGTDATTYTFTVAITTSTGSIWERDVKLRVRNL